MPRINLEPKKKPINNDKKIAQKYVYNTKRWKSLRLYKLQEQPLCEQCAKDDKVTLAIEIHHIQPFMRGLTLAEIIWLGFDPNNLMSVCEQCHDKFHKYNNYR